MNILAIDTSASACSVALQCGDHVFALIETEPMRQTQAILPMIQSLLHQSNLTLNELDAIAYSAGPGSFTGIRVACSVAQGLAFAFNTPVIAISSLATLAQTAYLEKKWPVIVAAVDARMKQIYWGVYQVDDDDRMILIGEEAVYNPNEVNVIEKSVMFLEPFKQYHEQNIPYYGVGDGWLNYKTILNQNFNINPHLTEEFTPKAESLLILAKDKWLKKDFISAKNAYPIYLREDF